MIRSEGGVKAPRSYFIAQEGWPFIVIGVLLGIFAKKFGLGFLAGIGWFFAVFSVFFFRNPERKISDAPGAVVSPADGKVLSITEEEEPYFGRGLMRRVTVFLSVADVHINRAPIAGTIKGVSYAKGRYHMAYRPEASTENERNAIWIQGSSEQSELVIVQIAGLVARRIVCYFKQGNRAERGMRLGLIRFGSRVDLYLPMHATIDVRVGDRVRGGSSVLGVLNAEQAVINCD